MSKRPIFDGHWDRLGMDLCLEARGCLRHLEDARFLGGDPSSDQCHDFMMMAQLLWELISAMGGNPGNLGNYDVFATSVGSGFGGRMTLGGAHSLSGSTEIVPGPESAQNISAVYTLWSAMYTVIFRPDPELVAWMKEALHALAEGTDGCYGAWAERQRGTGAGQTG
jgi:hypothetical protein